MIGSGNTESGGEQFRQEIESLAYRIIGDWSDSQDVAQETLLKWHDLGGMERDTVVAPRSWLLKVAARISLDRLKSARRRRESYVGPWLPDPLLIQFQTPADQMEVDETLTMALMLALERLTPPERVAFILKDVFDISFSEIADVLDRTPEACRKLASRARAAIRDGQPRYELAPQRHTEVLERLLEAIKSGDVDQLKALLTDDAAIYSDSGGLAPAARKVLHGADIITRLFAGLARKAARRQDGIHARFEIVNTLPALLLYKNDDLESVFCVAIKGDRIHRIYLQRNPGKLESLKMSAPGIV